jgi:hypothetical protein
VKTSDINLGGFLKLMLNGVNGSGKTRSWASFPGPIYCFDFDNRLKTVRKDFPDRTDIEYDTYGPDNFKKFDDVLDRLQMKNKYATIVIDSITSLTTTSVIYSLGETGGKTIAGLSVPGFDEYNVETSVVSKTLEVFKELSRNCHVIVTAHPISRLDTSGQGKTMKVAKVQSIVSYGMKLASIIPNYFDEIYSLQTGLEMNGDEKRLIYTAIDGENIVTAKTSLPLPKYFDVTNGNLFDILKGLLVEKGITLSEAKRLEIS